MTIHDEHPFATPEPDRDPLRRLRGRVPAPVSVWTTGSGRDRQGWTVSSMLVADGVLPERGRPESPHQEPPHHEPPHQRSHHQGSSTGTPSSRAAELIGLLDEDSELAEALERTRVVSVNLLDHSRRQLADAFARTAPAPGGPFRGGEWIDTEWGPRLVGVPWLGARVHQVEYAGWALLVRAIIELVDAQGADPMMHLRGRYLDCSLSSGS